MSAAAGQRPSQPPSFSYAGIYRTEDDAYDAIAEAQNALGFPCSKKRSKVNVKTGVRNRIDVRCHRSGSYRPWKHNTGQYQTSSRKTNCPFFVIIRFDRNIGGFLFEVVSEEHNHEPVDNPLESCRARRLTQVQFGIERLEKIVETRSKIPGIKAKDIAEQICSDFPGVTISRHDVLCMQNKIRRNRTGAFATIQDFLDSLKDNEKVFYYAVDRGPDEQLYKIFWIYRHNIEDWRRSPEVLMFDNTYKINHLNMPLLQITGTTPLHTNFSAGFGLTIREDATAYGWMLKQLKIAATKGRVPLPMVVISDFDDAALKRAAADIFDTSDQQVCMWHILKNITLNIRKMWNGQPGASEIMSNGGPTPSNSTGGAVPYSRHGEDLVGTPLELEIDAVTERAIQLSWQALQAPLPPDQPPGGQRRKFPNTPEGIRDAFVAVCRADSETDFWQRWAQLCYEFPAQKEIITYLHDTYVPERLQFAHFSVKWFQNYGIQMISRTKSSHLKDFFDGTSTDLCQLEQHIWEMVMAHRESYELRLQHELGRQQAHWDESSVVKDIALTVGSRTLDEILQQVRLALDELQGKITSQPCSSQFTKQMGLPCRHQIISLMRKSEYLELSHIDRHWWLKAFDQEEEDPIEQQEPGINIVEPARPTGRAPVPIATTDTAPPLTSRTTAATRGETSTSRRDGTRKDGRIPVPRRSTTQEQREGARRKLKRHRTEDNSNPQQEQTSEEAPHQPRTNEPIVQEQPQPSEPSQDQLTVNQQTPQTQQQVGVALSPGQRTANQTASTHTGAPVRATIPNTRSQMQTANAMHSRLPHGQQSTGQLTVQPPALSFPQQVPLAAPVVTNPLTQVSSTQANYQHFGGLAALNLYNMGGIPQQPPQGAFGPPGPQFTFRPWHPPRQG